MGGIPHFQTYPYDMVGKDGFFYVAKLLKSAPFWGLDIVMDGNWEW